MPAPKKWRGFDEARAYVRSRSLSSQTAYMKWAKLEGRPEDIPSSPQRTYKAHWKGWNDWLGTPSSSLDAVWPFEKARAFVHKLNIKTKDRWELWAKTEARPAEIPKNPGYAYRDKWLSWGDWLGTNSVRPADKTFWPFEKAHVYVMALGFKTQREYKAWALVNRPKEVPALPNRTYKDNWVDWGHWLTGTPITKFYKFAEAREKVRALHLRNEKEFRDWCKRNDRDKAIPANPALVYKSEWKGLGDWLGTERKANQNKNFWDFETARDYVQKLGLKNSSEWQKWRAANSTLVALPADPAKTYPEWKGMGDWLGSGRVASQNQKFRPFEEAREYMRSLGLKNQKDFNNWKKSERRPHDIPANPYTTYKAAFRGLNDYLGTTPTSHNRTFLKFDECVAYVRALGFKTQEEFNRWARSDACPQNIPASPYHVYQKEWKGYGHFLGIYNRWTKQALVSFLKSLLPVLGKLEPSELFAILRTNNCIAALDSLGENNPLVVITKAALHGEQALVAQLSTELLSETNSLPYIDTYGTQEIEVIPTDEPIDTEVEITNQGAHEASLPQLTAREILDALDEVSTSLGISDDETINFLIDKGVSRLWQSVLSSPNQREAISEARAFASETYTQIIRNKFIEEFDAVAQLPLPEGYAFKKEGRLVEPNLMQRLIAHRLISRKRIGNWSGTGAGKTLAAILGSRAVKADLTIVIGLNNTISDPNAGWAVEIRNAFPACDIQIKERGFLALKSNVPNYLLLNYESFQLPDSRSMVEHLVNDHKIDLIVLDEIHSAKSRNTVESKRRQLLNYLITEAGNRNSELRVLGMSATPVVNSLDEAASLLEMITSKDYSELQTQPTVANALGMHQQLILNGIRYRPDYKMELHEETVEIKATEITDRILNLKKGDLLGLENILLESKLPTTLDLTRPGTIIFSNFVEGIFETTAKAIQSKGLRIARFSGEDKFGLQEFKSGKADVLIGSSALSTGVDGLQYICNRLIVLTLPWTSAGYEQLLGRIYRQGSRFDRIEVFIPQVVLTHEGQEWSWDKQRFGRIKYKKTLADAAVDGFVPEGKLTSQEKMFTEAQQVLNSWIQALESGSELKSVERPSLRIPLLPEAFANTLRRYGDFSQMNARIGSSSSETTNTRFNAHPEEWYHYHSLYQEARKSWPEVPYVRIAESLARRPDWVVADFGCGEALLSKMVPNTVHNFDHIAVDDSVIACDMSKTPLDSESVDVAVFSLSLMGTNWDDYLLEAFRVLRVSGFIEISEPISKWPHEKLETLVTRLKQIGFQMIGEPTKSNQFFYIKGVKA